MNGFTYNLVFGRFSKIALHNPVFVLTDSVNEFFKKNVHALSARVNVVEEFPRYIDYHVYSGNPQPTAVRGISMIASSCGCAESL